jgi:phosphoribosylaminoimidazole-succinocarboxamide synthase
MIPLRSTTDLGLQPTRSGKVRDLFDLGDRLLLVATDRISAYDVVFDDLVPGKGAMLTRMSVEWFRLLAGVAPNHLVTADRREFPAPFREHAALDGRSMLVHKTRRVDCECIVRGYLSGSGWRDYRRTGAVCGIELPAGLRESERLPHPLFTPSTKADTGHDENIPPAELARLVGERTAQRLGEISIAVYERAAAHALERGLVIADTKFEFGFLGEDLILIDEVLTPDSSRFWPADGYAPGGPQQSFDKQFLRDWLDASGWDHAPPAPRLPADVVRRTAARYAEALRRLFPPAAAALEGETSAWETQA